MLVEIVVARETGDAVLLRLGAQQPACVALSGERPVDPAEGLDPDEVAQDEHVQRDLQLQLRLDLGRGVCGLTRLVVLDDPARAERVEVDAVDLPGQREGVEIEPSLQLLRRPLRPERHLEPARDELELRGRFVAHEGFEIAEQALLELAPLEVGQLHPDPGHRLREALAQELERPVELLRTQLLDPELLRQTGEELVQRRVCDLAA